MSRSISPLTLSAIRQEMFLSGLVKYLLMFLLVVFVSGCGHSQNNFLSKPTPTSDPKQSGYDLEAFGSSFSSLANKMADKYKEEDIDFIEEYQPELIKIARATDQLSVSQRYIDAKTYLSEMMWSQISFYGSIVENPSLDINSLIPVAQESTFYFNLFVIEMKNLGHDLVVE